MIPTQTYLEKNGDTIRIHLPGDVEISGEDVDAFSDLLIKGVDILAFSNKFNNTNQKSEIMPNGTGAVQEATQFEMIANRLDSCRGRITVATNLLQLSVDNLSGSQPTDKKEGEKHDNPGGSILSGLQRLLMELEDQVSDLEEQQNRLSTLLNITL